MNKVSSRDIWRMYSTVYIESEMISSELANAMNLHEKILISHALKDFPHADVNERKKASLLIGKRDIEVGGVYRVPFPVRFFPDIFVYVSSHVTGDTYKVYPVHTSNDFELDGDICAKLANDSLFGPIYISTWIDIGTMRSFMLGEKIDSIDSFLDVNGRIQSITKVVNYTREQRAYMAAANSQYKYLEEYLRLCVSMDNRLSGREHE